MSGNDTKYRRVFKRVETDDEFRARLIARGSLVLIIERTVQTRSMYGGVYAEQKREYMNVRELSGEQLDNAAWESIKMQRRIVEDVST